MGNMPLTCGYALAGAYIYKKYFGG